MKQLIPLVSVVIPNYNYGIYIGQCIESVLSQDYPNIEIIVVDDGSTDNSLEVLLRFGTRVQVIQQSNQGVSSARNSGLLEAQGEYIAFLDADDFWSEAKITKQVNLLEEQQADLVYAGVKLVSPDGNKINGIIHPKYKGDCSPIYRRFPARAVVLLGTSNALFRKNLISKSGLFDLRLSISADWDFFRRYCDYGTVVFLVEELTFYRQHSENMSARSDAFVRDTLRCINKMILDDNLKMFGVHYLRIWLKSHFLIAKYWLKSR